jgi:hypothetical protein
VLCAWCKNTEASTHHCGQLSSPSPPRLVACRRRCVNGSSVSKSILACAKVPLRLMLARLRVARASLGRAASCSAKLGRNARSGQRRNWSARARPQACWKPSVERAARQVCYLQQIRQFMVLPHPGNQTRFVGAADLFDRIKACNFFRYATSARSRRALSALAATVLDCAGRASFWLHVGLFFIPGLARLQAALIEIAPPNQDLVGIADVIERRNLTAGKLLVILMSQHLNCPLYALRSGCNPSMPCRR